MDYWESELVVERECDGWRLDRYLKHKIPRLSRSRLQRLLASQVVLDSASVKPARIVRAGQVILFRRPKRVEPELKWQLDVLYDDGQVVAMDKPAGLPMHPTAKHYTNTLTTLLRKSFPGQGLQIAHRLDRETSGVVLLGRGTEAGRGLKMQFAHRRVTKRYLALVHGDVSAPQGEIDVPLMPSEGPLKIRMEVADPSNPRGLAAKTRYQVVERFGDYSLLACEPVTGRQHQIRVHLAALGHPIVGDKLYGKDVSLFVEYCDRGFTERLASALPLERQALHASEVALEHPLTKAPLHVVAPLPEDMRGFIRSLRPLGGADNLERFDAENVRPLVVHEPLEPSNVSLLE